MIVGITGSSGSGKSTVAGFFKEFGFIHIDLDKISRDVTCKGSLCLDEITAFFGNNVLCADGSLNRRALGELVFRDEDSLKELNRITHKHILAEMNRIISESEGDILIDVPLLFESGTDKLCDFTVGVISDRKIQIERLCARDGICAETASARLDRQSPNEFFLENCDFCITNTGNENELFESTKKLISALKERALYE